jgi:hypothetical protein
VGTYGGIPVSSATRNCPSGEKDSEETKLKPRSCVFLIVCSFSGVQMTISPFSKSLKIFESSCVALNKNKIELSEIVINLYPFLLLIRLEFLLYTEIK